MFNAFNAISLGLTLVFSRYPSIKHIKFPFKHKIKKEDTIISKNVPVDDQCIEQIESNVSNTIKDINRRVHKCIEYFKKNEEITINACREITGEAGNSDVPKEILKDLISQKTAIVNLYRNILFIRPFLGHFNQNDGKNKKQFLFEIDHVVNFYIDLFKKYQKNKAHSILVETLVEHIFYVSCMQNFIGIQLLMLAETYHLRQKEKSPETFLFINDHTPSIVYNDRHNTDIYYKKIIVYINSHNLSCTDEELDELFISNYDIYKKWLSQKYNLIQNDSLVEAINTMVTNMRQYRDSYTIENYRYSFIYKMTNPYLIEMALKNHLENGFLDMDDIDKTIHIELFFEFMALYATNADAINERPIYKGFFLNDFLLTQTLLNNIIKTSAYVEKILVQDLQNEILYQNVVTSDTEEKIKSLGSDEEMEWLDKKPLEIIVNTIPPVNDHHQVHTMYKIVFQKSIKERIENLLLTNIAPKLNNLIVSLEDNSGLNAILAVEKQVFFSNAHFFHHVLQWVKKNYENIFFRDSQYEWLNNFKETLDSYDFFLENAFQARTTVICFFSEVNNILHKNFDEFNRHLNSLIENEDINNGTKSFFLHTFSTLVNCFSQESCLLQNTLQTPCEAINDACEILLNSMHETSSLRNMQELFNTIQRTHDLYKTRSEAIKLLYIRWAKNNRKELEYNDNELATYRNFIDIYTCIYKEISEGLNSILAEHQLFIPKEYIDEANIYLRGEQNQYLIDFIKMNNLCLKIYDRLPAIYTEWALSLQLLDKNSSIKPSYHKENLDLDVIYNITPKALKIMEETHAQHKITNKLMLEYLHNIRYATKSTSTLKENYELWIKKLDDMKISPVYLDNN